MPDDIELLELLKRKERRSYGHDESESGGAEMRDGVEDDQLADGGRERDAERVEHERGMLRGERERRREATAGGERDASEQRGEDVHAEHHVQAAHVELFEQALLPVAREAVRHQIRDEDRHCANEPRRCRVPLHPCRERVGVGVGLGIEAVGLRSVQSRQSRSRLLRLERVVLHEAAHGTRARAGAHFEAHEEEAHAGGDEERSAPVERGEAPARDAPPEQHRAD